MSCHMEGLAYVHSWLVRGGKELFPPTLPALVGRRGGVHVVVTMGTFFAVGWYGGRLLLHSDTWVSF
jgi:hypothetical protein